MKYHCEICSYIYDSKLGDPKQNIATATDLEDLPSNWVCPLCGVGKENFYPLGEDTPVPAGEAPQNIMIMALTQSLWQICGRGSCAVTREIGKLFIKQLKSQGITLDTEEDALKTVQDYFIKVNKFARGLDYEIKEDNVELEVKNCRFFGICSQLEDQSIVSINYHLSLFQYCRSSFRRSKRLSLSNRENSKRFWSSHRTYPYFRNKPGKNR